jgi:hypothetical protein
LLIERYHAASPVPASIVIRYHHKPHGVPTDVTLGKYSSFFQDRYDNSQIFTDDDDDDGDKKENSNSEDKIIPGA